LARIIGRDVDPLAIHKAREGVRKAIAIELHRAFADTYRRYRNPGPFSPAPEAAGRRALRNAALAYLAARGRRDDIALVARHFAEASNATDEVAGLAILAALRTQEREKAFARFYERWKKDSLVIDSWFAYQASSPLPGCLQRVGRLT